MDEDIVASAKDVVLKKRARAKEEIDQGDVSAITNAIKMLESKMERSQDMETRVRSIERKLDLILSKL